VALAESADRKKLIWTSLTFSRPFGTGIETSERPVCFQ
jgi:hypothetical protein